MYCKKKTTSKTSYQKIQDCIIINKRNHTSISPSKLSNTSFFFLPKAPKNYTDYHKIKHMFFFLFLFNVWNHTLTHSFARCHQKSFSEKFPCLTVIKLTTYVLNPKFSKQILRLVVSLIAHSYIISIFKKQQIIIRYNHIIDAQLNTLQLRNQILQTTFRIFRISGTIGLSQRVQ